MFNVTRRQSLFMLASGAAAMLPGVAGAQSAADPSKVDRAGRLRFFYYKPLPTYDVHKAFSGFDNAPLFLVYDRLVHQSANGDAAPGLATSWTFSDDAKTLTMKLRTGVKFHDGTDFNAEAVKLNLERAKTVEGSAVASDLKNIVSVKVIDPETVELALAEPAVSTPLLLSDRGGAMISPAAFGNSNLNIRPIGAGMYRAAEDYQQGVGVKLDRFEEYWDPEANLLAGVDLNFTTDATARLNALRSGAADLVGINPDQIDLAKRSGLNVTSGFDLSFSSLTFNPDLVPELKDERVRLAINLALDREALVAAVLLGHGAPSSQPFPEGYFAFNPDVPPFPYDLDRAKALMAEAGVTGFDLELMAVPDPIRIRTGEAVAGQLEQIGIRVKVSPTESGVMANRYITEKSAAGQCNAWSGRADPAATLAPCYLAGGWQNPGNVTTDTVMELYQKVESTIDPEARAALLRDISRELVEHPLSIVTLFRPLNSVASNNKVVGFQSWMSGKVELRGVGMAA